MTSRTPSGSWCEFQFSTEVKEHLQLSSPGWGADLHRYYHRPASACPARWPDKLSKPYKIPWASTRLHSPMRFLGEIPNPWRHYLSSLTVKGRTWVSLWTSWLLPGAIPPIPQHRLAHLAEVTGRVKQEAGFWQVPFWHAAHTASSSYTLAWNFSNFSLMDLGTFSRRNKIIFLWLTHLNV